ncbi:RagB/SusD family nutrient uptake outer membrane protein [Myroides sp. N17-2]|uniref:RagB/SusD family nutrient uptake outer membrane protein n=1 Tax=Myroides sp. N17-2 TaxID=2030799 RepID=UPI000EFBECCE|nr:RagB/SusD family nutrient uptake outer membrane protein [Myroides sp. N17-2]
MKKLYNYNFIKLFYICLTTIVLQACDSFIDTDLPNDKINTQDVFKDIYTTKAALNDIYAQIRQNSVLSGDQKGLGFLISLYTDDLNSMARPNSNNGFYEMNNNLITANNEAINSIWNTNYKIIYNLNSFIDGLGSSTYIPEDQKKTLLAEAYFLRALIYYYLVQLFGDIPYTKTTDYNYNNKINKTNYNLVLNNIENDLIFALQGLSNTYRSNERIYPNKATANLLLSKLYLLQKNFSKAEEITTELILDKTYELETDISRTFKKNAKSTLWQFSPQESSLATQEAYTYIINTLPVTTHHLSSNIISLFEPTDTRFKNWVNSIDKEQEKWFYNFKYKNKTNNTDEYSIIMRLEEAYYVLIESLIYQNKTREAIHYMNVLRQYRNLPSIQMEQSASSLLKIMLEDSRLEFFCEHGHRFFDLKRNNKLEIIQVTKPNWKSIHTLFPIPEKEILLNPNLLPQNNGY